MRGSCGLTWTVAAPGPSLPALAGLATGKVIAVNDAWRVLPMADVIYGADPEWWFQSGPKQSPGERWTCTQGTGVVDARRSEAISDYGLKLAQARDQRGFCTDPNGFIHTGYNSGFQAVNLAIQKGAKRIYLIGFDMREVDGRAHYFGDHPAPLTNTPDLYPFFIEQFNVAARMLPDDIEIVNWTPGSAIECFPFMEGVALARAAKGV